MYWCHGGTEKQLNTNNELRQTLIHNQILWPKQTKKMYYNNAPMNSQVPSLLCPGYSYCMDRKDSPKLLSHTHGHLPLKSSWRIGLFQPKSPSGISSRKTIITHQGQREGLRALTPRQSLWVLPHSPGDTSLYSPTGPGKITLVVLLHSWLCQCCLPLDRRTICCLASIRFFEG